ncbi:MAG: hypothetical protein ABSE89_08550 [Sedimentisphaerales bacterium]
MNNSVLPYGISDLKPAKDLDYCCPIKDCKTPITKYPSKKEPRDCESNYCEEHRIYCRKNTYIYEEKTDNLITDIDLFKTIFDNPGNVKFDTKRIGYENSEDALSWNVFATLKKANELKNIASLITGKSYKEEPELILWGYNLNSPDKPINELEIFRKKYEFEIRVQTEPDIILNTAKEVFLIEAKFCSPNSRKDISVWKDKEVDRITKTPYKSYKERYGDLIDETLNTDIIEVQNEFCSQLIRYALYANAAYGDKTCYIVNLLPKMHKEINSIEGEFKPYLKKHTFKTISWEDIYKKLADLKNRAEIDLLKSYLQEKTANLKKAFKDIPSTIA